MRGEGEVGIMIGRARGDSVAADGGHGSLCFG